MSSERRADKNLCATDNALVGQKEVNNETKVIDEEKNSNETNDLNSFLHLYIS